MRLFLIIVLLSPLSSNALAECRDRYTESEDSTCKIFGEVDQADVTFDPDAKEFRFNLSVDEITYVTRRYYNCFGRLIRIENASKSHKKIKMFKQPEEGHADFTLAREVNQYVKDRNQEICK